MAKEVSIRNAKLISKRMCEGYYEVRLANGPAEYAHRVVTVKRFRTREGASFSGWIAAAEWDRYCYTDPLDTKGEAMFNAENMLRNTDKL